jgi:hypothetical protein
MLLLITLVFYLLVKVELPSILYRVLLMDLLSYLQLVMFYTRV